MKLTSVLTINALFWMIMGLFLALYGPMVLALFEIPEIPQTGEGGVLLYWNIASFARLSGAALFSFGLLLFSIRSLPDSPVMPAEIRRGVLAALVFGHGLLTFVAITQQFSVWTNLAGWIAIAIPAIFFFLFLYFLVAASRLDRGAVPTA